VADFQGVASLTLFFPAVHWVKGTLR